MKNLVIVGATGMIGGCALRYALQYPDVGRVTAIGRRSVGISHPKLREVLHKDFSDCTGLADALSGQDAALFCLGAYTGVVSDDELRKTTAEYPVEFARVLRLSSPQAAFSLLSGQGADRTGQSLLAFARYKGEAEKALLEAGFLGVYIFRAAYIYPVQPRNEPSFSYRLMRLMYPVFRFLTPSLVIASDDLAQAMVDVVVQPSWERQTVTFENRDIRARWAKS